jgi:hypothetical protein
MAPTSNAPASAWLCGRCGSCYFARPHNGEEAAVGGVRSVSYYEVMKAIYMHMDGDTCPVLRESDRARQCTAAQRYAGRENRKQKRFHCPALVTIVPLAADFRVAAQPTRVVTKNLSGGGAALAHRRRVNEPYLAIDFSASGIDLLPAILRVTRVRKDGDGFEIGGKFISRILH